MLRLIVTRLLPIAILAVKIMSKAVVVNIMNRAVVVNIMNRAVVVEIMTRAMVKFWRKRKI
jgi:hypothetical protein